MMNRKEILRRSGLVAKPLMVKNGAKGGSNIRWVNGNEKDESQLGSDIRRQRLEIGPKETDEKKLEQQKTDEDGDEITFGFDLLNRN